MINITRWRNDGQFVLIFYRRLSYRTWQFMMKHGSSWINAFTALLPLQQQSIIHCPSLHLPFASLRSLFLALCLFPTFLAEGDGVVHDPADQSHDQPQQNEEDPVLPHPRDQELLAARRTHWGHRDTEGKSLEWVFTGWRETFLCVSLKRSSGVRGEGMNGRI